MLYLQAQHGLSFEQTEHLVRDRLSWMRFCGLTIADSVPDANTLWDFREALIAMGALERLFERLDQAIKDAGADCRRQPGCSAEATEHQRRERRDQGRQVGG